MLYNSASGHARVLTKIIGTQRDVEMNVYWITRDLFSGALRNTN